MTDVLGYNKGQVATASWLEIPSRQSAWRTLRGYGRSSSITRRTTETELDSGFVG